MSTTRPSPISEFGECACAGKNLDRFIQPAILAVLAQGPVHGYRIVQRLAFLPTFGGHEPDASGVYRFLKVMEDRKLVSSAWDLSESGPAKRMFDLLPKGRACLTRWVDTLDDYQRQIAKLAASIRKHFTAPVKSCGCSRKIARRRKAQA